MKKDFLNLVFLVAFAVVLLLPADKASAITSYSSAVSIDVNREYTGTIPNYSTDHFYKFTLPKDGKVELKIKNVTGAKWYGKIVDSKGTLIDYVHTNNDGFANGYNSTFTGLPAGTYYAVIEHYSSTVGKPYAFSVDYVAGNNYEKEQNNTLTTANQIRLNQQYEGVIHDYNDDDFYKFTLSKAGNITLTLDNVPNVKWYAAVYNSKGERYGELYTNNSELTLGKSSINIGLPAGTYYVKVDHYTATPDVVYKMKIAYKESNLYEKEFNNTVARATPLKLNNSYKGAIQDYKDIDLYKFTLSSASNVTLSLTALEGKSWRFDLQDSKGRIIDSFNTKDNALAKKWVTINVGLPKGTYYVKISNYTSAVYEPYTLKINAKASKNGYEKELNDSLSTATTLPLNTSMQGTLSYKTPSDKDYFKFVVPTSGNFKVSMTQKPGYSWFIYLYDRKGNRLHHDVTKYNEFVKGAWTHTIYLRKGTYYLYVSNYTRTLWKPYTIKVSKTTAKPRR